MKELAWRFLVYLSGGNIEGGYAIHRAIFRILGVSWWNLSIYTSLYTIVVFGVVFFHVYAINSTTFTAKMETDEDFNIMILNLVGAIVMVSGTFKHVLTFFMKKRLAALIEYMETKMPVDELFPGIVFCAQFAGQVSITAGGYSISGLIFKDKRARGLLWACDFPWDYTTPVGQFIAIFWQTVCAWVCFLQNIALDTVPVVTVYKLRVHIRKLKEKLLRVGNNGDADSQLIAEAVDLHNAILKGVSLMNSAYELLLLYQVCYMVIHGCVLVYCVATLESGDYLWRCIIPMLVSAYFELFVFCRTGQMLASEMEELAECSYDNAWYDCSPKNKSSILLILTNAQREIKFESYGITAALYPTYLASAQESCSYFLFLRTMSAKMDV